VNPLTAPLLTVTSLAMKLLTLSVKLAVTVKLAFVCAPTAEVSVTPGAVTSML
jgi:hypothetical protein